MDPCNNLVVVAWIAILLSMMTPQIHSLQSHSTFHSINSVKSKHRRVTQKALANNNNNNNNKEEKEDVAIVKSRRRMIETGLSTTFSILLVSASTTTTASAIELYRKSDNKPMDDPDELLTWFASKAQTFQSLNTLIENEKFEELSRSLRSGEVSESRFRRRAYALIDMIEDERKEYVAAVQFRTFLTAFDILERTVYVASQRSKSDGGIIGTIGLAAVAPISAVNEVIKSTSTAPLLGSGDARINLLSYLEETSKNLQAFNRVTKEAIDTQNQKN